LLSEAGVFCCEQHNKQDSSFILIHPQQNAKKERKNKIKKSLKVKSDTKYGEKEGTDGIIHAENKTKFAF